MWLIRRIVLSFMAWFVSISLVFILARLAPGNPAQLLLGQCLQQGLPYDQCLQMVRMYLGFAPDEPLWLSYIKFVQNLFSGNLGQSIQYRVPVSSIVAVSLAWTIFFVSYSLALTVVIGVLIGLLMAFYRHKAYFINTMRPILAALQAIPSWMLGFVLFYYIGYQFQILPYRGSYARGLTPGLNAAFIFSVLQHYTLPTLAFLLTSFPGWALATMSIATTVLRDDYVIAAKARGIPKRRILWAYVARNSILPIYTNIAISFAYLLTGAVWIENIFQLYGLGNIIGNAVGNRDYPLIVGGFLIIISAMILGNLFTDLTYALIDPRARIGEGE